jgi:hypothetical protein
VISFAALYEQQCQDGLYCEGTILNAEEQKNPVICALCAKKICDECAFGVRIPGDVLGEPPWDWVKHYKMCSWVREHGRGMCPHSKPTADQHYDALVCSDCFKEEWA